MTVTEKKSRLFADRVDLLGTENAFKVGDDIRRAEQAGMKMIKLNLGEPDFVSAEHINRVAIDNIKAGNSHYTDPQGIMPLREAVAAQIARTRGLDVSPQQVVVTTGAKPPISYTMMSYVNPGDEVIYPSPGFPIYESWVEYVGAKPMPIHLEEEKGFRFEASALEKLMTPRTKVLIINSPSNPTGGVFTKADLDAIADIVRRKARAGFRIYSDEVYEDILFDGARHHSIAQAPEMAEKTIIVSGHSKSYAMTGWRLGYAVLPTVEEALVFRQFNINIISCTPPFIQEAGREAIVSKSSPGVIAEMASEFQRRRDVIVPALNAIDGIRCQMPEGAFYAFPNIAGICERLGVLDAYDKLDKETKNRTTPSTLFQLFALYRHGVATMDRRSFGAVGSEGKHYLRLSMAAALDELEEGVRRIAAAADDRDGFKAFIEEGKHLY